MGTPLWNSDAAPEAIPSIRGFGAAIGRDSACSNFGRAPGICVMACKDLRCANAQRACHHLRPACTGVTLNVDGSLATLKSSIMWADPPPQSIRHQSWWRMDECRSIKREARKLLRLRSSLGGRSRPDSRYYVTEWRRSPELQFLERWRGALCNEYIDGPMIGRLQPNSRYAGPGVNGRLVMDIGFADGGDSAMFLRRGFHVVAVEADPATIERARTRHPVIGLALSGHPRNGTGSGGLAELRVQNVAIADEPGQLKFYSPAGHPDMASIHASTCKGAAGCKTLSVPADTCASLFARHGTPLVLKIDIEGADLACLRSLRGRRALPPFVAIEDNSAISTLAAMGYTHFKLVKGRAISSCDRMPEPSAGIAPSAGRARGGSHAAHLRDVVQVANSLGGMPWECANTVPGAKASSWTTASQTRAAPHFDQSGGGFDLHAWMPAGGHAR